ncbi:hypothetical protein A2721_02455 [Candidatus Gottesmanbacteria bacterium RIFCSPHIGHO2_01_FULL_47_48]|uniref:Major facilitator superfamily (MFS) profile domain-containing protein n=1 Tax=Candidatus Gottesmanbacteria bacterium RIFCSPHIGHO2_01_FULL_47_48 TaxID=1798381 RepID=A0A1F6A3S3_9BACT|nr:MAG: hypothetical protein A2721_02455 [Candidatus Gottesmanbacteria bacterium RIFCSPHIGHO2_01_FULL_47_48]
MSWKILLGINLLWYLGEGLLGPLFTVFAQEVGGSVLDISAAWATYLAVTGVAIILIGKVSDRSGAAVLILIFLKFPRFFLCLKLPTKLKTVGPNWLRLLLGTNIVGLYRP